MLQKTWVGCDGRAWGGAWLGTRGQLRTQTHRIARTGALVVILARGEGVNCCAPLPLAGSRAATQSARRIMSRALLSKNMYYMR